ncbi:MAG: sensor histidine kinase [Anaerolineae bacterium]|nr:MAG: two-component sensor histidine kinase [Chloroflexi bacterium OLB13]MBW7880432.1 sensor histidine kinase [Anaerolineae bacterium]
MMTFDRPRPFGVSLRWRVLLPIVLSGIFVLIVGVILYTAPADRVRARFPLYILMAAMVPLVAALYVGLRISHRMRRTTDIIAQLAAGHRTARLNIAADEFGDLALALNRYAEYVQEKADTLRSQLRVSRQETTQLAASIDALPEGVIVLDLNGRVVQVNTSARKLLAPLMKGDDPTALTETVTDALGDALAPGVYALGDPMRVDVADQLVQAQVTAVMNYDSTRVGTVVLLRKVLADSDVLQLPHETSVLPLETLIWKVSNEWRQIAINHHIELQVQIKTRGLKINGDIQRLSWALGSILDNAIKYTPAGGTVMLQTREPEEGRVTIRVRDNGVGIKREELPHVFTRFYRGNPETDDGRPVSVPGSGQGLALARQIVIEHGGEIDIKSRPGAGTAVYVILPLID